MAIIHNHTVIVHQMTPPVPPLYKPKLFASSVDSQVACKIVTKPTMLMKRKLRFNTCCLPIRDMSAPSCVVPPVAGREKPSLDTLASSVVVNAAAVPFWSDVFSICSSFRIWPHSGNESDRWDVVRGDEENSDLVLHTTAYTFVLHQTADLNRYAFVLGALQEQTARLACDFGSELEGPGFIRIDVM